MEFNSSYARSVYLEDGAWKSPLFKAYLQPTKRLPEEDVTLLGRIVREPYLYIGPAAHDLSRLSKEARLVDSEHRRYRILHAQKIYKGDKVFYIRAILEK